MSELQNKGVLQKILFRIVWKLRFMVQEMSFPSHANMFILVKLFQSIHYQSQNNTTKEPQEIHKLIKKLTESQW